MRSSVTGWLLTVRNPPAILSNETIVEQHPWVTDVEAEMARLQKEKEEAMAQAQEYAGAFQTGNQNKGDNGEGE